MYSNRLAVQFDGRHNKVFNVGGVELIRPDMWEHTEHGDYGGEHTKWMENFNMKDVHPQIGTVCFDQPNLGYKKGERLFFHYMAKEAEELIEIDGDWYSLVFPYHVFFKIEGEQIIMADDMYLGEQVYTDAVKTDSGIYLTSQDKKKETLKIKILHVPKNRKLKEVNVGDIVCTDDDHQYYLNYDGRDYIKLHHNEIAAKFVEA